MPPRASLQAFMATARAALAAPTSATPRSQPLTFVIGNESADLDSLCSAIVLAYMRTHTPPHTLHIPLSNLPRDDLSLRPEMTAALNHAGLAPSDLLTLSDLPDLRLLTTRWLLVDHNAPTGQLRDQHGSEVIGCIDHHADEKYVATDASPRVVEPCGSCMSLVVRDAKTVWQELAGQDQESKDAAAENEKLAKLALAPILIDTTNLKSKDKVQPADIEAVQFLETLIRDPAFNRTEFFDAITEVKADISKLSLRDIFRKDYKEWQDNGLTLGISSVVQNLDYLISTVGSGSEDEFLSAFEKWAEERNLDIASIMTTSHGEEGEFKRELVFWGISEGGKAVLPRFADAMTEELGLEKWKDGKLDTDRRMAWRQNNLSASRKQVAPYIREVMKGA
ncbi:DHHA2 domain-containing protein [Sarocladium implicatum]|nr:DHHA2 domain-containing protein [Sarocladium implicatum]